MIVDSDASFFFSLSRKWRRDNVTTVTSARNSTSTAKWVFRPASCRAYNSVVKALLFESLVLINYGQVVFVSAPPNFAMTSYTAFSFSISLSLETDHSDVHTVESTDHYEHTRCFPTLLLNAVNTRGLRSVVCTFFFPSSSSNNERCRTRPLHFRVVSHCSSACTIRFNDGFSS